MCVCMVYVLFVVYPERLGSFTAVYPGGLWNLQIATLGDDPQDVDLEKAGALSSRSVTAQNQPSENYVCTKYVMY